MCSDGLVSGKQAARWEQWFENNQTQEMGC